MQPGELPPDLMSSPPADRPLPLRLLFGNGRAVPSTWVWEPWLSGLLVAGIWTVIGLLFYPDRSLTVSLLVAAGWGLYIALTAEFARRWHLSGRGSFRGLRTAVFVLLLMVFVVVLALQDRRDSGIDYDAFCREATTRTTTPQDLVGVQRRIEGQFTQGDGNHIPKGDQVAQFSAAVKLSAEAKEVAAPYQLPVELRGNLPPVPDTTRVRALQAELAAACRRTSDG